MPTWAWRQVRRLRRCAVNEDGAGTTMALFGTLVILVLGGLAIDVGNAWREQRILSVLADSAAHAGIVELAKGGTDSEIRQAVERVVVPTSDAENRADAPAVTVDLVHFAADSNEVLPEGETNAVVVTLRRNRSLGNAVPLYLLGLAGAQSWNIAAQGAAALSKTARCDSDAGLFGRGPVLLGRGSTLKSGVCVHSQVAVFMSTGLNAETGSWVSMPDLETCPAYCDPGEIDGLMAVEANLLMQATRPFVSEMHDAFTAAVGAPQVSGFFAARQLAEDMSALEEVGVDIRNLEAGQLVTLSPIQVAKIRKFPAGLIYSIRCSDGVQSSGLTLQERYGSEGTALISDAALVTNCPLRISAGAGIRNSLVISDNADPERAVELVTSPHMAQSAGDCQAGHQSWIMTTGSVRLEPGLRLYDLSLAAGGDIVSPGGASNPPRTELRGGMHAGGQISIDGPTMISDCPGAASSQSPDLRVIRYVHPT